MGLLDNYIKYIREWSERFERTSEEKRSIGDAYTKQKTDTRLEFD